MPGPTQSGRVLLVMTNVITLAQSGGRRFWTWFALKRRRLRQASVSLSRYSLSVPAGDDTVVPLTMAYIYSPPGAVLTIVSIDAASFDIANSKLVLRAGEHLLESTMDVRIEAVFPSRPHSRTSTRLFRLTITA